MLKCLIAVVEFKTKAWPPSLSEGVEGEAAIKHA
jgi:hypothetical protein